MSWLQIPRRNFLKSLPHLVLVSSQGKPHIRCPWAARSNAGPLDSGPPQSRPHSRVPPRTLGWFRSKELSGKEEKEKGKQRKHSKALRVSWAQNKPGTGQKQLSSFSAFQLSCKLFSWKIKALNHKTSYWGLMTTTGFQPKDGSPEETQVKRREIKQSAHLMEAQPHGGYPWRTVEEGQTRVSVLPGVCGGRGRASEAYRILFLQLREAVSKRH